VAERTHRWDAIRYVEEAVTPATDLEGLALRYGSFYGPRTGLAEGGDLLKMIAKRRLPSWAGGSGRSVTSTTPRRQRWPRREGFRTGLG
jgi:hypothetical protein